MVKAGVTLRAALGALFPDTTLGVPTPHPQPRKLLNKRVSGQPACSACPGSPPDLLVSLWPPDSHMTNAFLGCCRCGESSQGSQ